MEIYADELAASLRQVAADAPAIREFVPSASRLPWNREGPGIQELRWSRYVSYPRQARRGQSDVNHVLEHGYGHLLWALDPARTIVTVHDLIPLARWAGRMNGVDRGRFPLLNKLSVNALRRARYLIADSRSTARDLVDLCGCGVDRIRVIPLGVSARFVAKTTGERQRARASFGFPGYETDLILILGNAYYKNLETSLAVLRDLLPVLSRPAKIVHLGQHGHSWVAALKKAGLGDHVIEIDRLSRERVPDLYNSVDCLLFPSHYEGFGWPVLEAMACGVPVVCSDAASLPEIAGDAAILAKATDVAAIARGVKSILENRDLRTSMIDRGRKQAAKFRWDTYAAEVMGIYREILGGPPVPKA